MDSFDSFRSLYVHNQGADSGLAFGGTADDAMDSFGFLDTSDIDSAIPDDGDSEPVTRTSFADSVKETYGKALDSLDMLLLGCAAIASEYRNRFPSNDNDALKRREKPADMTGNFNSWLKLALDGGQNGDSNDVGLRSRYYELRNYLKELESGVASVYKRVGELYDSAYRNKETSVVRKELRPIVSEITLLQRDLLASYFGSKFYFGRDAFQKVDPSQYMDPEVMAGERSLFTKGSLERLNAVEQMRQAADTELDHVYARYA